jgi:hypothetical protein
MPPSGSRVAGLGPSVAAAMAPLELSRRLSISHRRNVRAAVQVSRFPVSQQIRCNLSGAPVLARHDLTSRILVPIRDICEMTPTCALRGVGRNRPCNGLRQRAADYDSTVLSAPRSNRSVACRRIARAAPRNPKGDSAARRVAHTVWDAREHCMRQSNLRRRIALHPVEPFEGPGPRFYESRRQGVCVRLPLRRKSQPTEILERREIVNCWACGRCSPLSTQAHG